MDKRKYLYKDAFAVIGIMGEGPSNDISWIPPLWESATARFSEIEPLVKKNADGMIEGCWGAMNDVSESNALWGERGRYMAGCEADTGVLPSEGWTKWIIPAQKYLVVDCTMETYGEVFASVLNDPDIKVIATVHERYPEPGNPDKIELYFPVSE